MTVSNDSPIVDVIREFADKYPYTGQTRKMPNRETGLEVYRVEDALKQARDIKYRGGQTGEEFVNNAFARGDRLEKVKVGRVNRNMMVNPHGISWEVPRDLLPYVQVVMQYGRTK